MQNVAIVGATGVVGRHILAQLLSRPDVARVWALGRRAPELQSDRLTALKVDLSDEDAVAGALPESIDTAFCGLGSTMKQAGSKEAFYAIDHDAVLHFARAAKGRGAKRFVLISALGARADSRNFYLKTKGEAEQDVARLGFDQFSALRPSLIDDGGKRGEFRLGEQFGLPLARLAFSVFGKTHRFAPIHAETIARAALRLGFDETSEAVRCVESDRLHSLVREAEPTAP